jgi:hypothetical protein
LPHPILRLHPIGCNPGNAGSDIVAMWLDEQQKHPLPAGSPHLLVISKPKHGFTLERVQQSGRAEVLAVFYFSP